MNHTLAENLKKFRMAKGMTQEQAAAALNVNAQTVSRWECASTLPDALTLPILAQLYGVTIDDFYKKHSIAYDNYAQRLASVYEQTDDPEDFLRCILEFQKLIQSGTLSMADEWNLAAVYHQMFRSCKEKALVWYDKVLAERDNRDAYLHGRARSMRMKLMFELGKGDKETAGLKDVCEQPSGTAEDWSLLLEAYLLSEKYQEGYEAFCSAIKKFPENWHLYIHGGEICKRLQRYEEALSCLRKAGQLGTDFHDEDYGMAYCYEAMGEYEKASEIFLTLADKLRLDNYDVEANMAEEDARRMKLKKVKNS